MNLQRYPKQFFTDVAVMFIAILFMWAPQSTLAIGNVEKGDALSRTATDLSGTWRVYIGNQAEDISAMRNSPSPISITLQTQGNKLSGSVAVPSLTLGATIARVEKGIQHQLMNVKYDGKTLEFKVDDNGNTLEASLIKVTDNEFVGDWKSPVNPPWKSSKSQFWGKIVLKR